MSGEATGFAHASALDEAALKRAAATVKAVRAGRAARSDESPRGTNQLLYADDNPIDGEAFARRRWQLLQEIDAYVRGKEPKAQPGLDLARGLLAGRRDHPRRRLARRRRAAAGAAERQRGLRRRQPHGSRQHRRAAGARAYGDIFKPEYWQREADEAIRQALVNLAVGRRRRPARCRWCWVRAGRACCGTRRSATGSKATSTARRPRCSPA